MSIFHFNLRGEIQCFVEFTQTRKSTKDCKNCFKLSRKVSRIVSEGLHETSRINTAAGALPRVESLALYFSSSRRLEILIVTLSRDSCFWRKAETRFRRLILPLLLTNITALVSHFLQSFLATFRKLSEKVTMYNNTARKSFQLVKSLEIWNSN